MTTADYPDDRRRSGQLATPRGVRAAITAALRRLPLLLLCLCASVPAVADTGCASGEALQVRAVTGAAQDYAALLVLTREARVVLLGEATHGSQEFYRERARISRLLIDTQGVTAIALEAPWQAVRRLDRYIAGEPRDGSAATALHDFRRFPRWLWRNEAMRAFAEELRILNEERRARGEAPVRLYGLDLYGLHEAADAVVHHLARQSLATAAAARRDLDCFAPYYDIPEHYGLAVERHGAADCAAIAAQHERALRPDGDSDEDRFHAWMSARLIQAAENYYRALYRRDVRSWNERERFLADTLELLLARHDRIVVWAHNIHQGDARATDQAEVGELSLGQLIRERHGTAAVLIGLTTHRGTVRAAPGWGEPDRIFRLRPATPDSVGGELHRLSRRCGLPAFLLVFRGDATAARHFAVPRLERFVGVSYLPHDERRAHYMHVRAAHQFDALLHIDRTTALPPLR